MNPAPRSTIFAELSGSNKVLRPVKNPASHGFGRASVLRLAPRIRNAQVILKADESDGFRYIVPCWKRLAEDWCCVSGSRAPKGGRTFVYPATNQVMHHLPNGSITDAVPAWNE